MKTTATKLQKLGRAREKALDSVVCKLEKIYLGVHREGNASWQKSFAVTKLFIVVHMLTFEFHFILFAMILVAFTTGIFINISAEPPVLQAIIYLASGIFAGLTPLALSILLFPLHVKFRMEIWLLVAINVLLSAVVFSFFQPLAESILTQGEVLQFSDLFSKMLIFYAIAVSYLQSRINSQVCLNCFIKRHDAKSLLNFMPASKRGTLISFTAQDHYVEIVTTKGKHLQRMSMKNAMALVPKQQGLQVHRSHWVAYQAILAVELLADRHFLILRNGMKIPVSKAKLEAIEAYLSTGKIGAELL